MTLIEFRAFVDGLIVGAAPDGSLTAQQVEALRAALGSVVVSPVTAPKIDVGWNKVYCATALLGERLRPEFWGSVS